MALLHPKQLAQGGATSNQALTWNGSIWAPGTISTFGFETDTTGSLSSRSYLFAHWPLGEVDGTRLDVLGRVPLLPSSMPACIAHGGPSAQEMIVADFNGSSSYLYNTDNSNWFSGSTAFSVSAWFKADTLPSSGNYAGVIARTESGTSAGWGMFVNNPAGTTYLSCFTGDGVSAAHLNTTQSISAGSWYHGCIAWDGTTKSVWLNAQTVATSTPGYGPITPTGATNVAVGKNGNVGTGYLDGKVCLVTIWRGVSLTNTDVTNLYGGGTPNRLRY